MKQNAKRILALLLCGVLLTGGWITAAAESAEPAVPCTLEYYDNPSLESWVLIVTYSSEYAVVSETKKRVCCSYEEDIWSVYCMMSVDSYDRQVFEQDGKLYPQLLIRLEKEVPITAVIEIPEDVFRTEDGEPSGAMELAFSDFRLIEFTVELYAENLTAGNQVVVGKSQLTPRLICDGICARAYSDAVRYYPAETFKTAKTTEPLSVPFTPTEEEMTFNGEGSFAFCAWINEWLFCSGKMRVISPYKAYLVGLQDDLKDRRKILPYVLLAIPGWFMMVWPAIHVHSFLISMGIERLQRLFDNIFASSLCNRAHLRLSDGLFSADSV